MPVDLARLWATGVIDFGLSGDSVGRLVPGQFLALHDRWVARENRENWRTASICSAFWEIFRDPSKRMEPVTPEDFLRKPGDTGQTPEQMFAILVGMASNGGKT